MTEWTSEELKDFADVEALQKRPYEDDGKTFEQDIPTWTVPAGGKLYVRGAKGGNTKWVAFGTKNGGQVAVNGKKYEVDYELVTGPAEIEAVTAAFKNKYPAGPILTMMTGKVAESATVKLVKR